MRQVVTCYSPRGQLVTATADRLTKNFALMPALVDAERGTQYSTEASSLLHIPSGYPLLPLTQWGQAEDGTEHRRSIALDRNSVVILTRWLEALGDWSVITAPDHFAHVPMTDAQRTVVQRVVRNPNNAPAIIDAASRVRLNPNSRQPTVARIASAGLQCLPHPSRLDERLQFVPPRNQQLAGSPR